MGVEFDDSVLAGLKNENAAVQERFWNTRWPDVQAACLRVLRNPSDAAEVAVDVMADFMTSYVRNIADPQSADAYLRLMAVRRSLKFKNRRDRSVPLTFEEVVDTNCVNPELRAVDVMLMPKLRECLEQMTPKAQTAVRMRYRRHMTTEEIGRLVGASKQYIGRLLKQSIEFLRQCMETEKAPKARGRGSE